MPADPLVLTFLATLAAYGTVILVMKLRETRLVYPGSAADDLVSVREATGLDDLVGVEMPMEEGRAARHIWHPPDSPERAVVIFCQGNAAGLDYWVPAVRFLIEAGHGVLLVGYRGYGGRPGRPSEAGIVADALSARRWLDETGIDPRLLVYHGISLGSGVACALAARRPPAALVLEAPFTSMAAAAQWTYPFLPVATLVRDKWRSDRLLPVLACPTLVIHGEPDRVVPVHMGRRMLELAGERGRGVFLPDASHVNCLEFPEARRAMHDLLSEVEAAASQARRASAAGVSTSSSTASSSTGTSTTASA